MTTISHGYGKNISRWLPQLDINGRKIYAGLELTFLEMIRCAKGKDHTFVSIATLAKRRNVSIRTIQRHIADMKKLKIIKEVREWINGWKENVFYFLKHEIIDEFKASLKKSKKDSKKDERHDISQTRGSDDDKPKNDLGNKPKSDPGAEQQMRQVGDNLSSVLTNRKKDVELSSILSPAEGTAEDGVEPENDERENLSSLWEKICDEIGGELACPAIKFSKNQYDDKGFLTISAITSIINILKKHEKRIEVEAKKHGLLGVVFHSYTIKEIQQETIKEEMERTNNRIKIKQQQEQEKMRVNSLPLENKFLLLLAEYPKKNNIDGARRTFNSLYSCGVLLDVYSLLQKIKVDKMSDNWQKDNGRWIPFLEKWLLQNT